MSNIAAIIDVIEALAVTATTGGTNIAALDLTEHRDAVPAMECPIRVILPSDEDAPAEFGFLTIGKLHTVNWSISDLLLYQQSGEGYGWYDVGNALVTYAGNYATAAAGAVASLRAQNAQIQTLTMRRGTFTYSGTEYYGVMCTWTIKELLQCP
jgi:hypothetical protein